VHAATGQGVSGATTTGNPTLSGATRKATPKVSAPNRQKTTVVMSIFPIIVFFFVPGAARLGGLRHMIKQQRT